jgi:hypothetical protein
MHEGYLNSTGEPVLLPKIIRSESLAFAHLPGIQDSAIPNSFIPYQTTIDNLTPGPYTYKSRAIEVILHCVSTTVMAGETTSQIVNSSRSVIINSMDMGTDEPVEHGE